LAHEILVFLKVPIKIGLHVFSSLVETIFEKVKAVFVEVLDAITTPSFWWCGCPGGSADSWFGDAKENGSI
jgi:hypothetical protein